MFFRKKPDDTPSQETPVEQGLQKSRDNLFGKIRHAFKSTIDLNDAIFEQLEEILMTSDMGVQTSLSLVDTLRECVNDKKIKTVQGVIDTLHQQVQQQLNVAESAWNMPTKPHVIVVVGVNGVGKTTTTAKIAYHLQSQGKKVLLAGADTFRAAAVEQLRQWGERLSIDVIAQPTGSDAAAVAHDAFNAAIARQADVLLIDTAGRLHTQDNLMTQLSKLIRVLQKINPDAPQEVMQIVDAGTGQNALNQIQQFNQAVGVSSLCLTKLDGSAKGGIALAISQQHSLPIRFIGVGEKMQDLLPFSATEFANALLPHSAQWDTDQFSDVNTHFNS